MQTRWSAAAAASALALLLCAACSDSATNTDSRPADLTVSESAPPDGPATEAGADGGVDAADAAADLSPDGPKPPARWAKVSGAAPGIEDHRLTLLGDGRALATGGEGYINSTDRDALAKTYIYDATSNSFSDGGDMNTERFYHSATLLDNGRVLVTGGQSISAYEKSTELFDPSKPAASAWSKGPDMQISRWGHAAIKLKNGEVLITGGFASIDSTDKVVIYAPTTNNYKFPASVMKEKRRFHEMVLLPSGKVLIIGGVRGDSWSNYEYSDTMEIYDPQNGTFTLLPKKMSKKRTGHRAVLLDNGKVLIVGGFCGRNCQGGQLVNDLYDPLTDTITPISSPGDLPSSHAAVLLADGRVLVVGDEGSRQKVVAFDPSGGGLWSVEPDMLAPGQSRVEAVRLGDGSVLVVGGVVSTSPYTYTTQAQRFYP